MKILKYILISLITTFIIIYYTSPSVDNVQLSEEDLEWLNMYNIHDTVVFTSGTDIDTLHIYGKRIINPEKTKLLDGIFRWYQLGHFKRGCFGDINIAINHNGRTYLGCYNVGGKIEKELLAKKELQIGGLYTKDSLTIENESFILKRHANAGIWPKSDCIFDEILFTKKEGIVMYKTIDNTIYRKLSSIQ